MGLWYLSAVLLMLLYMPGVFVRVGMPALHIEDLLIGGGAVFIVLLKRCDIRRLLFSEGMSKLIVPYIALLAWITVISLLFALFESSDVVAFAALFKCVSMWRPIVFLILFMAVLLDSPYQRIGRVIGVFAFLFVVQIVVMYLQSEDLFGVNEWLTPRFNLLGTTSIYSRLGLRSDGTFGNPNDAAVALVPFAVLCYSYLAFGDRNRRRAWAGAMAGLSLAVVLGLAKSRAGAAAMVAGFFVVQGASIFLNKRRVTGVVLTVGLLTGMALTWAAIAATSLGARFAVLFGQQSLVEEGSFAARLLMWRSGLMEMGGYLVTGRGIGDYVKVGFFDGGYVAYLYSGGCILVVLFLIMAFGTIRFFWHRVREEQQVTDRTYLLVAPVAICVAMLVATISHPLLFADRLWLMYLTVLALAFAQVRAHIHVEEGQAFPTGYESRDLEDISCIVPRQ